MRKLVALSMPFLLYITTVTAQGCRNALINGKSHVVSDSQLSASSSFSDLHLANNSRLHLQEVITDGQLQHPGAWCVKHKSVNEWIQVDFKKVARITGIATQGRNSPKWPQYVRSYVLEYSKDCQYWQEYTEEGATRVFIGNWDRNSVHKHLLKEPFGARCLRLYPKSWFRHMSLRWEVYGCIKSVSADVHNEIL